MKTCLIKQPAGIGDILLSQGIAKHYIRQGYNVIHPVKSNLCYLQDYIKSDGIEFCNVDEDFLYKEYYNSNNSIFNDDFVFLNLDTSHMYTPQNDGIMPAKYQMLGLDYTRWIDELNIIRNTERENWLFYEYLKLKDNDQYILLNNKFGTPPNYAEFPIPELDTKDKLISMDFIENTTIMDWLLVMEKASGIVTVDTCVQYLLEKLNINYQFYYCYTRDGTESHIKRFGLDKIFRIKWQYIHNN